MMKSSWSDSCWAVSVWEAASVSVSTALPYLSAGLLRVTGLPLERDIRLSHRHGRLGVVDVPQVGWDGQQEGVEEGTANDAHEENTDVITEFISKKSHNWWCDEDTERQDGVHQSYVHVIDANVLHVNCQVGHNGKRCSVEEKKCEFEWQKIPVKAWQHQNGAGSASR